MYPNPPPTSTSTSSTYNFLQFQSETTNTTNGDDNTNYRGGGAAGGGVTSWSTAVQPPPPTSGLIRQSSSPPAFFHQHLISDFGISHKKEGEGYNLHPHALVSSHKHKQSRLSSDTSHARRLSSTRTSLKRASTSSTPSTSRGFTIGPWEECDSIDVFDPQVHHLSEIESIDKLNVEGEDSVAWRIRAKRGFATDPRSIAERERRIRINCKLKKLEELLPNIDRQTSYAEMLDLAFEHVKGLQSQIQELNEELDSCTCECNHDE